MNCKLKDCPHNKGQDIGVNSNCHPSCSKTYGIETNQKGDEVKTKRFKVTFDTQRGPVWNKDSLDRAMKADHYVPISVRELPEPSQDVEATVHALWNDYLDCEQNEPEYAFKKVIGQFVADNKRPEPIKLKSVETGVLMSPAEILGIPTATWMGWSSKNGKTSGEISTYQTEDKNRVVVDISKYPREFYKEIKTEVDYSSIPVGSLIRALCKSNCLSYHGTFVSYRKTINEITIQNGGKSFTFCMLEDTIEILSLPEVSK